MGNNVIIDEQVFTDIADAIRERNGETATYKPREMAEAVGDLHNVRVNKWVRPSDWPDYSKVDLTDQEVIYLTYDCTYDDRFISVKVAGAYTVERGSLNNGVFTAVSSTNQTSGSTFQQTLPTNEGDYVVYRITPQSGANITSFRFAYMTDENSSKVWFAGDQPCIERYCNIPNHTATFCASSVTDTTDSWITFLMVADTVMGAKPDGSCANSYRNAKNKSLVYVDLSACSFADVTNLQYLFYDMKTIKEIYLPHDLSDKCTNLQGMLQNCEPLVFLDLTGWDTGGVTIFGGMFQGCLNLSEIKGIEDFSLEKATNTNSMFYNGINLSRLDTSKWKTTTALTNCGNMFYNCRHLSQLDLSGFVTDNVASFSGMFIGCIGLKTLNLNNFVVSNKTTSLSYMFQYCRNLKNLIRNKNWDTSNVTSFECMFQECSNLKEIDISDFDFSKATVIKTMFSYCTSMKALKATINLAALTTQANVANFASTCWNLEDISELTFTNCLYMPYFGYCYVGLKSIKIPASVTTIPTDTFRDCYHLQLVDCRDCTAVPALANANAFILNSNTKQQIVVPDALYDEWIAATNWSDATLVTRIIKASDYEASLAS